jgi:hypothetical protein
VLSFPPSHGLLRSRHHRVHLTPTIEDSAISNWEEANRMLVHDPRPRHTEFFLPADWRGFLDLHRFAKVVGGVDNIVAYRGSLSSRDWTFIIGCRRKSE